MNNDSTRRVTFFALLITLILFVLGRLLGMFIPSAGWAFDQWSFLPWWYLLAWAVAGAGLLLLLVRWSDIVESVFESPRARLVGLLFLVALLLAFRFNSFLYGGGNYQVAKLAQTETIIHRWYEFGSLWAADIFYRLISSLKFTPNTTAYIAWKALGFIGTLLTLIASIRLSSEVNAKGTARALLFGVLFFGPQTVLYFNFVGFEPLLIAVIYWFTLMAIRAQATGRFKYIGALWLAVLIGVFLHVSMVMLIPAALFVTLKVLFRGKATVPFVLGIIATAGLAVAAYLKAYGSMEYGEYLLFLHNRNLQMDYNLFTPAHIFDFGKLILMTYPLVLVLLVLLVTRKYRSRGKSAVGSLLLLSLAGLVLAFMVEPTRGMALDAPIMSTFLAPLALLLAALLQERVVRNGLAKPALGLAAALALLVPFSTMPVYSRIGYADGYIKTFLNSHPFFWYEGGTAMRDAYFYEEDNPKKPNANRWDQAIPVESEDFLDLTAGKEYILAKQYSNALQKLYKLKTKYRYWLEPRFLIATVQTKLGRYDLAKPEIDTCLMIDPYDKASLVSRYRYYLNISDIPRAVADVNKAIAIYPNDNQMKADLAIYWYRSNELKAADSLSASLIQKDSTLAYPHLIRGFIAELKNEPRIAMKFYQSFIRLAPDAPETPQVRKKLNDLVLGQQKKAQ